jgi:lipoprotein-releasing system ATP-binding protein
MLKVENVSKSYPTPRGPLSILTDISLSLSMGDAVSIMGPSGTGKSTLLYIIGALEPPTSGTVTLHRQNPFTLNQKQLAAFRNQQIGFVFQDHCLLPHVLCSRTC